MFIDCEGITTKGFGQMDRVYWKFYSFSWSHGCHQIPKSFKVLTKECICPFSNFIGGVNTKLLEIVGLLSASESRQLVRKPVEKFVRKCGTPFCKWVKAIGELHKGIFLQECCICKCPKQISRVIWERVFWHVTCDILLEEKLPKTICTSMYIFIKIKLNKSYITSTICWCSNIKPYIALHSFLSSQQLRRLETGEYEI